MTKFLKVLKFKSPSNYLPKLQQKIHQQSSFKINATSVNSQSAVANSNKQISNKTIKFYRITQKITNTEKEEKKVL